MLISEKHVEQSELILVYVRVVGFKKRRAWKRLRAVRGGIPVPHELDLSIASQRIVYECAEAGRTVHAKIVDVHADGLRVQRIGTTSLIPDERRDFELSRSIL